MESHNEEANLELADLLKTFLPQQLDFLQARLWCKSDKEAADAIGLSENTVYCWSNKADVNKAVLLAKQDGIIVTREKLRRLGPKAVDALESELQGRRKIEAAKEILDRIGLESRQGVDLTTNGPLVIVRRERTED